MIRAVISALSYSKLVWINLLAAALFPRRAVRQRVKRHLAKSGGEGLFHLQFGLIQLLRSTPRAESFDLHIERKKSFLIARGRQTTRSSRDSFRSHLLQSPVPHPAKRNAVQSAAWEPLHRHIQTSPTGDTADLHWSWGWEKEIGRLSSAKIMKGATDEYYKSLIMHRRAPDLPFKVWFPISSVGGAEYRPDKLSSWLPHTAPCWSW